MYYVLDLMTDTIHGVYATPSHARTEATEMGPEYIVTKQIEKARPEDY